MIRKRLLTALLLLPLLLLALQYITGQYPLVIDLTGAPDHGPDPDPAVGDTLYPLAVPVPEGKALSLWIVMDADDLASKDCLLQGYVWVCRDAARIREMQAGFAGVYTGGDMATVESRIFLYAGDSLLISAGIAVDAGMTGLQSRHFGWLDMPVIEGSLVYFERCRWPLLLLRD